MLKCPKCQSDVRVIETRLVAGHNITRRRYKCMGEAHHRFTTLEVTDEELGVLMARDRVLAKVERILGEKVVIDESSYRR